jgi:hypothetical protein
MASRFFLISSLSAAASFLSSFMPPCVTFEMLDLLSTSVLLVSPEASPDFEIFEMSSDLSFFLMGDDDREREPDFLLVV